MHGYRRTLSGWLALVLWSLTKLFFRLLWRFLVGLPMDGKRRTNATFLQNGDDRVGELPHWFGQCDPTWWAYLAGYKRALIRLGTCAALIEWLLHPQVGTFLAINVAGIALVVAVVRQVQKRYAKKHLEVLVPLFGQMANYLGPDVNSDEDPRDYLELSRDWRTNREAKLTLTPPGDWDLDKARLEKLNAVVVRHLGTGWDMRAGALETIWSRAPAPPRQVLYADLRPERYDMDHLPVARAARGKVIVADLTGQGPHMMITGGSGAGKSQTLCAYMTHMRTRATETQLGLQDYIDLKIGSMVTLRGAPGVRIHTEIDSAVWAICEFCVSLRAANMAIDAGVMTPGEVPHRSLVIDEFSSLMTLLPGWWKRHGGKGEPPVLHAFLLSLMQGRSVDHRVAVGVHSPKAGLFQGTEGRDLLDFRIYIGKHSDAKWRMAFGKAAKLEWDRSIVGRCATGEGEGDPEESQLAALAIDPDDKEAAFKEGRRLIDNYGAPVPDWFSESRLPPWVTQEALDRAWHEIGIDGLDLRGTAPDASRNWPAKTPGDVPHPSPTDVPPDYTRPALPVAGEPLPLEELPERRTQRPPEPEREPASARPNLRVVRDNENPITGYAAAAAFLTDNGWGMGREKFKDAASKARRKDKPIPNEWWDAAAEQWCWWPTDLLRWQHARRVVPREKGA